MEEAAPTFAAVASQLARPEPVTQAPVEAAAPEPQEPVVQQDVTQGVQETQETQSIPEQVAPSTAVEPPTFESALLAAGFNIDDSVDREALYKTAAENLARGREAMRRAARLEAELENLKKASQAAPAAPAPTQGPVDTTPQPGETQQQADQRALQEVQREVQRALRELQPYDRQLETLVTQDQRTGQFIPKPEFGAAAVEAARAINEYNRLEQQQAQLLLRNPFKVVEEYLPELDKRYGGRLTKEEVEELIKSHVTSIREEQEKQQEQLASQRMQQEMQQQEASWHESNKSKIFRLGADGNPLQSAFNDEYVVTPQGQYFFDRLNELRGDPEFRGVSDLTLRNIALREAEAVVKPKEIGPTPAQRRAEVVNQTALPHQDVSPATSEELGDLKPTRLKFAEFAQSMPETQSIVSAWNR